MHDLLIILKAEFTSVKNSILKSKSDAKKFRNTVIMVALVAWLLFMLSGQIKNLFIWLASTLAEYPDLLSMSQLNMLSALTLGMFVMMLVTGFTNIYNTMYNSGDLNFLMGTPLSIKSIFTGKMIKSLFSNLVGVAPFILPVWIGFGLAYDASFSYYIMVILTIILQVLLFTCVVSALMMLVTRLVSSSKLKQIVKIAPLILAVIIVVAIQLISAFMANSAESGEIAMSISNLGLGTSNFLPHIWIVKSNLAMLSGYSFSLVSSFVPLLLLTVAVVLLTLYVADKTFLNGWSISKEVGTAKKTSRSTKGAITKRNPFFMGRGQTFALTYKDWLIWKRQPLMWYGILIGLIGMVFFAFNMSKTGDVSEAALMFQNVVLFISIMFGTISSGGLSIFSVSMDGESLWLLRSSPISASKYYASKLFVSIIPGILISLVGLIGLKIYPVIPSYPLYISIPVVIIALMAIESIQITTDILKPNFDLKMSRVDSNRKMNDPFKSLILTLSSIVGSAILVAAFAFPLYGGLIPLFSKLSTTILMLIGFAIFLLIAAILISTTSAVSIKQVKRILKGDN